LTAGLAGVKSPRVAEPPRRVPIWGWTVIAPCAAMALIAIDLGARAPLGDPLLEGIRQMIAATVCSGAAFGAALLSRLRRPLPLRLGGCALLLAASALALFAARPKATGAVEWRRAEGFSRAWSAEFPAAPSRSERTAPTAAGEMPLSEAAAAARGATFRVQETQPPGADREGPRALLLHARAAALPSGRERIIEETPIVLRAGAVEVPGLELRFRLDGHDYRARIYAAPPRVLTLTAGPLDAARPEAQRFFESFALAP
jgi:hypothetical protein